MLMSEAIRLGAMLRPQCDMVLFRDGRSCALGAAIEAAWGYTPRKAIESFYEVGRNLNDVFVVSALGATERLGNEIFAKNDSGMTREAIADWLVESGNDFEVQPLPKIEAELSPADVAAIQEVTHG